MAEVDKGLMAQAIKEWRGAPHRTRGQVLAEWLSVLGVSRAAFYRDARGFGMVQQERKTRSDKGEHKNQQVEAFVKRIQQIKHRPPPGQRIGSTEGARNYALSQGMLQEFPPEVIDMPVGSINRIARELNLRVTARRENRFEAHYANQVHQFDASHSEHFIPHRKDSGEWVLRMRRRRQKNKEKAEHMKLVAYGICDDYSGYRLSQYVVAPGESALGGINFLQWAWSSELEHAPFEGWPEILYSDNGPLTRHQAFSVFAERLTLKVETHMPYRSQATGKVENNWRTLWKRFETEFFFNPAWESLEISLTEFNQETAAFWKGWNQKRHRRLPISREMAWHRSILDRGGVVRVEPGAWDTIFVEAERNLDAAGCFDYRGATYQVKEIWNCKGKVFCNIRSAGGDACATNLIVQAADGKRYTAVPYEPARWGEFRGSPKSELDLLKEADIDKALKISAPITWRGEGNLVHLPVRGTEVRESGFEMPEAPAKRSAASLDDIAAGMTVEQGAGVRGQGPEEPEIYASEVEWYEAMLRKQFRGEQLSEETMGRMDEMRLNSRAVKLLGGDMERRARLAAVE